MMDLWLAPHDERVRSLKALRHGWADSPFGACIAAATDTHLVALHFTERTEGEAPGILSARWPGIRWLRDSGIADMIGRCLESPAEVPVMAVGTPFQLTVWECLRGSRETVTMTYGEVARAVGRPKAARAVGRAVGANEIAVAIPCHRVVSLGHPTGYRWGWERKKALLAWELSRRDPLTMPF